jgi:hypothetical protein
MVGFNPQRGVEVVETRWYASRAVERAGVLIPIGEWEPLKPTTKEINIAVSKFQSPEGNRSR